MKLLERNLIKNTNPNIHAVPDKIRLGDILPLHLQISQEEHRIGDKEHEQDDLQDSSKLPDEIRRLDN